MTRTMQLYEKSRRNMKSFEFVSRVPRRVANVAFGLTELSLMALAWWLCLKIKWDWRWFGLLLAIFAGADLFSSLRCYVMSRLPEDDRPVVLTLGLSR